MRSRFRSMATLLFTLALGASAGCGGAPSRVMNTATAAPVTIEPHPFRITFPAGYVLDAREGGAVFVNGEAVGTVFADGRFVEPSGETTAALLADGRISFHGTLSGGRVEGLRVIENGIAVLELVENTMIVRNAQGEELTRLLVVDLVPEGNTAALYVTTLFLLEISREQNNAPPEPEPQPEVVRMRVPVEGAPQRGNPSAPVTIVMFADFQCPFSQRSLATLQALEAQYPNRLRFVYRHQPLPFHPNAHAAAEASVEAYVQGGDAAFYRLHDLMFQNQRDLGPAELERFARLAGLDLNRFRTAMAAHTHASVVDADSALGNQIGAAGTPTFFINGRELVGAQPAEAFASIINEELATTQAMLTQGMRPEQLYPALQANALAQAPQPAPSPGPVGPPRDVLDPQILNVPVGSAPQLGNADALLTLVVFTDLQCPFCSRLAPNLAALRTELGRDLRIVWRNNPLPFHQNAQLAAEAALEVRAQRGDAAFFAFTDVLFANQEHLDRPSLEGFASQVPRMNMRRFRTALDTHVHAAAIATDVALAQLLGASGTPNMFINGHSIRGALPIEELRRLFEQARQEAEVLVQRGTPRSQIYQAIVGNAPTAATP